VPPIATIHNYFKRNFNSDYNEFNLVLSVTCGRYFT